MKKSYFAQVRVCLSKGDAFPNRDRSLYICKSWNHVCSEKRCRRLASE